MIKRIIKTTINNIKKIIFIIYYLFNNLFASKNITYKNAIQMTLKVLTKRLLKAKII